MVCNPELHGAVYGVVCEPESCSVLFRDVVRLIFAHLQRVSSRCKRSHGCEYSCAVSSALNRRGKHQGRICCRVFGRSRSACRNLGRNCMVVIYIFACAACRCAVKACLVGRARGAVQITRSAVLCALFVQLKNCHKRLLRHFDRAELAHTFFALFLLFEQLFLSGYVAAVALCKDLFFPSP